MKNRQYGKMRNIIFAKILDVCKAENIQAEMTSQNHKSGTDRCYEVSARHNKDYILNVQGDEPFCNTDTLINLCNRMKSTTWADIGTVVHKVEDGKGYHDPNVVKAALTSEGQAIYFSRSPMPYYRDNPEKNNPFYHHQGIYAYKKTALKSFVALEASSLEHAEKLEQLRALEHGMSILCVLSNAAARGVDTHQDLEKARAIYQSKHN